MSVAATRISRLKPQDEAGKGLRGGRERDWNSGMFTRPDFRHWPAAAAFLIIGLLVWVVLPGMVVTLDDCLPAAGTLGGSP